MKFKLFTAMLLAFTMVSCNKEKAQTDTTEVEATPSAVSGPLAELVQKLDGDKYVSTQLNHATDYFIVYNTASW